MKIDIDKLSEAELVDLNNRIVERLRFLAQMRTRSAMLQFSIGERSHSRRKELGPFLEYSLATIERR